MQLARCFDSLDCGIPDNILDRVRINHTNNQHAFRTLRAPCVS